MFTTKRLRLVEKGVELDLYTDAEIESVTVTLYPNGGTGDPPKKTVVVGKSRFQGVVQMRHGGKTVNRATVIANLPDGESENMHRDDPNEQWGQLDTESPGPTANLHCLPGGCPPAGGGQ